MPNVKDEPRPQLARRVRLHDHNSVSSLRSSFYSTRRDSCGRWLWRLVRRFGGMKKKRTLPRNTMYEPAASWRSNAIFSSKNNFSFVGSACPTRSRRCHLPLQHSRRISSSGATGSTPTTGQLPCGLERAHQAVEWPGTRLLPCVDRGTATHQ
jgi:hypothetical protein